VTNWTIDIPCGVWVCEELSQKARERAELKAKKKITEFAGLLKPRRNEIVTLHINCNCNECHGVPVVMQVHEFGVSVQFTDGDEDLLIDRLATSLARVMPNVVSWVLMPHLRRSDVLRNVCSCGAEFEPGTDYGKADGECMAHVHYNPLHTMHFERRPGNQVCWYGMGLGPLVTTAAIPEGAVMPELPACLKPTTHAPDCECASFVLRET